MNMKENKDNLEEMIDQFDSIRSAVKLEKIASTLTDEQKEHNREVNKKLRPLKTTVETLTAIDQPTPGDIESQVKELEAQLYSGESYWKEPDDSTVEQALTDLVDLVGMRELVYKAASKLHNEASYTLKHIDD